MAHLHQLLPDLALRLLHTLTHALLLAYLARHSLDDLQLGPSRTDYVFVCRGTKTALSWGEFFLREKNFVCKGKHLIVAFSLLGQLCQQHVVLLLEILPLHHYILKSNHSPKHASPFLPSFPSSPRSSSLRLCMNIISLKPKRDEFGSS